MVCGHIGCGRYTKEHAKEHFCLSDHSYRSADTLLPIASLMLSCRWRPSLSLSWLVVVVVVGIMG